MTWQSIMIKTFAVSLMLNMVFGTLTAGENPSNSLYKENVAIHLGRETYISGELIWFKAYCFSNRKDPADFLSKVLYAELINEKNQAVSVQVLEINHNTASSVMQIPDTLATGLYYLTSYTQWMRNAGRDNFFSQPIFIYNQYDEDAAYALANYSLPLNPEIYIEGGRLIAETENRIILRVPGLFGRQISGTISEAFTNEILQSFTTDKYGIAELHFIPKAGTRYGLALGDSVAGKKTFELPQTEFSGYVIFPVSYEGNRIYLSVKGSNVHPDPISLIALSDGKPVAQANITKDMLGKEISLSVPEINNPFIRLELQGGRGDLLTSQSIILNSLPLFAINTSKQVYGPHEKVDFEIIAGSNAATNLTGLSVGVYKNETSDSMVLKPHGSIVDGNYGYLQLKDLISIFPKSSLSYAKYNDQIISSNTKVLPVEDDGILFTGRVVNSENSTPFIGVEVNLALHDSTAKIYASLTDSYGKFAMLTNVFGNKTATITLKYNEQPLSGNYSVLIDDKFSFLQDGQNSSLNLMHDQQFIANMKDEAQRVLIQRAFRNSDHIQSSVLPSDSSSAVPFYGKPLIVVYPGKFIVLPNFEEIAREILPRVRYKQFKTGCDLFITDVENNIKSNMPVILLDGVTVANACELYSLNSDDIQRIDIQSGYHISGNFLYNGLIAIYTTGKYKEKNKEKNGRFNYFVPGYVNNASPYVISTDSGNTVAGKGPDFKNQLYWNPDIQLKSGKSTVGFCTSDEEGEYIIDALGYTRTGYPLHFQQTFKVTDH